MLYSGIPKSNRDIILRFHPSLHTPVGNRCTWPRRTVIKLWPNNASIEVMVNLGRQKNMPKKCLFWYMGKVMEIFLKCNLDNKFYISYRIFVQIWSDSLDPV